jgi:hypothetical protein
MWPARHRGLKLDLTAVARPTSVVCRESGNFAGGADETEQERAENLRRD